MQPLHINNIKKPYMIIFSHNYAHKFYEWQIKMESIFKNIACFWWKILERYFKAEHISTLQWKIEITSRGGKIWYILMYQTLITDSGSGGTMNSF